MIIICRLAEKVATDERMAGHVLRPCANCHREIVVAPASLGMPRLWLLCDFCAVAILSALPANQVAVIADTEIARKLALIAHENAQQN